MKTYDVTIRFTVVDLDPAADALKMAQEVHPIAFAVVKDLGRIQSLAVSAPAVRVSPPEPQPT